MVSGIIFLVLFALVGCFVYFSLPPGKLGLDRGFFNDLEADGERIAQALWAYHEKNGKFPNDLTEVKVPLNFTYIVEWHLNVHPVDMHGFHLSMAPNGSGALIGISDAPDQIKWTLTIMH